MNEGIGLVITCRAWETSPTLNITFRASWLRTYRSLRQINFQLFQYVILILRNPEKSAVTVDYIKRFRVCGVIFILPGTSAKACQNKLDLFHCLPYHWHHLLAHILGLGGNVLGGCGLFTAWLPDRRVSESAWTTAGLPARCCRLILIFLSYGKCCKNKWMKREYCGCCMH